MKDSYTCEDTQFEFYGKLYISFSAMQNSLLG